MLKQAALRKIATSLKLAFREDANMAKVLSRSERQVKAPTEWLTKQFERKEGLYKELKTIPDKEYTRVDDVRLADLTKMEHEAAGHSIAGTYRADERSVLFDPDYVIQGTGYHEFAHARQFNPLFSTGKDVEHNIKEVSTMGAFINLSRTMPYQARLIERHARAFERIMISTKGQANYDEAFRATARVLTRELKGDKKLEGYLSKVGLSYKDLLIGALAVSGISVASPDEAEAGIWTGFKNLFRRKGAGKWIKPGVERMATVTESSADKVLKGKTLGGKVITGVEQGTGDWRKLSFEDGSSQVVKKEYIHDLARHYGTEKYIGAFQQAEDPERYNKAVKSLKMRERTAVPLEGVKDLKAQFKRHQKHLGEFGAGPRDQALCKREGRYFSMPKEYAEHLQNIGQLEIVEYLK